MWLLVLGKCWLCYCNAYSFPFVRSVYIALECSFPFWRCAYIALKCRFPFLGRVYIVLENSFHFKEMLTLYWNVVFHFCFRKFILYWDSASQFRKQLLCIEVTILLFRKRFIFFPWAWNKGCHRYLDLHLKIYSKGRLNETLRQKRWFQFSHCELSIYM